MKDVLTPRQQEILDFVRDFNARHLMPPTLKEISEHFHIRCSSAAFHLEALRKKGRLSRTNSSRKIVLEEPAVACKRLDCLRRIDVPEEYNKLAIPDKYEENNEDNSSLFLSDRLLSLCSAKEFIAFRQPDDSMFDLGIHSSDLILAVPVKYRRLQSGDIVLAELPDGRTVIRSYYSLGAQAFELVPANPEFMAERYSGMPDIIKGVVVTLTRSF